MMKSLSAAIVAVTLLVAGCTTSTNLTTEGRLGAACQGYASLLSSLALNSERLSEDDIEAVNETRSVVNPICTNITGVQDTQDALLIVREATRKLNEVQQ